MNARPPRFLTLRRSLLFFAALTACLSLTLILPFRPVEPNFTEGSIAPVTVKSPANVPPYPSKTLMRDRQQDVANAVQQVLITDAAAGERQLRRFEELAVWLDDARAKQSGLPDPPADLKVPARATISTVLSMPGDQWTFVRRETQRLLAEARGERATFTQLPSLRAQLLQRVAQADSGERLIIGSLLDTLLEPTLIVDFEATQLLREAAIEEVSPVLIAIGRGETILRDGQMVTALHLEKLAEAGLLHQPLRLAELAGGALLTALLAGMLTLFLYVTQPPTITSHRRLLLLGVVLVMTVFAAKVALPGRPLWALVFPLAAAPMLLSVLLQLSLGLTAAAFLAVLCTYVTDFSLDPLLASPLSAIETLEKVVLYLVTGTVAAIIVGRASRVLQYFSAGGIAALAGMLVVTAFWLLNADREAGSLPYQALGVAGGGMLSAGLTVGFSAVLGVVFDVTTRMQLHELGQTDHPLLRRMLQEAPGTYYHSLLVGNLSEQACEAVGADALLARVGAYYHDIGKLRNPGAFIENQRRGENIHDRIDPYASARMIIAHVPDGVTLAQEHRLPEQVLAFIREHHGCRLTLGFYNKATHIYDQVLAEHFRYPGPPPQTREAAIVMLADSVEAITRSEETTQPEQLDGIVDRIFAERLAEGELNQCDLTLRDLETVRQIFKTALRGLYHPRVRYPLPAEIVAGDPLPVDPSRRDQPDGVR